MNKQLFTSMVAQYTKQPKWADGDTLEWSGGTHCNLPSLVFNGECKQYGTPTPDKPLNILSFDGIAYVRRGDSYSYLYTPYLNGIGDYKDKWDYVTGKGLRYIHKVELDGVSEYGKISTYKSGEMRIGIYTPEFALGGGNGAKYVLSTHFKPLWNAVYGCIYATNGGLRLIFDDNLFPSGQSVTDWLIAQKEAGTPVTVYYAMAEPIPFEERSEYDVYEPIPNESGHIDTVDSSIHPPFNITYITHS